MKNFAKIVLAASLLVSVAVSLVGCGDAAPSKAPAATGTRKPWDQMSKQEKIDSINKSGAPNKEGLIKQIQAGTM